MVGVLFLKSGAPHQSQAPASEFRGDRSSVFKNQGRPISPRLQPRSSGVIRLQPRSSGVVGVLFLKNQGRPITPRLQLRSSGVIGVLFLNQGRPISPRLYLRSSGVVGVLILNSGAPHQSQAPASEFRGDRSSVFKIRGGPSVLGSSLGVQGW